MASTTTSSLLPSGTLAPGSYTTDPILALRPSFALSMPVQVLLIGVVLTLMCVLLGHLLFTAQYHWPLAPTNFALQLSGVLTLLVTQTAMMHVVFSSAMSRSSEWPYMFEYIAIDLPPFSYDITTDAHVWTRTTLAAWSLMNAATAAIVQITHIQFLTLLYPSKLERNLILAILGPLALTSAVMQLVGINCSVTLVDDTTNTNSTMLALIDRSTDIATKHLIDVADVVNNVCDATLSLLFTSALLLWGLVVNRRQAWRLDGGTAAFGAAACVLALVSTGLTFAYLPKRDQYGWLPSLILAIILWQSFMGWWWWVGAAGAGVPADELIQKAERRRQRKEVKNAKRLARNDAAKEWWRGFTSTFSPPSASAIAKTPAAGGQRVERKRGVTSSDDERSSSGSHSSTDETTHPRRRRRRRSGEDASSTAGTSSSFPTVSSSAISAGRPAYTRWFHSLRQAHRHAARRQAAEHHERVAQAYGPAAAEGDAPIGWGLGSYGARELAARREEADSHGNYAVLDESRGREKERRRPQQTQPQPTGMLWWGPLRRWRLQDSTSYQ